MLGNVLFVQKRSYKEYAPLAKFGAHLYDLDSFDNPIDFVEDEHLRCVLVDSQSRAYDVPSGVSLFEFARLGWVSEFDSAVNQQDSSPNAADGE